MASKGYSDQILGEFSNTGAYLRTVETVLIVVELITIVNLVAKMFIPNM